jgi:hypothetical protein
MMANHPSESQFQEVLIQIASTQAPPIEQVVQAIERVGGRVLHAYPPSIIIAALPPDQIASMRTSDGIQAIDTEEIVDLDLLQAAGARGWAIAAWNAHVLSKRQPAPASRDLPWDAPGYLPPDPPADVREMLRRRERELQEGDTSQADEEDQHVS